MSQEQARQILDDATLAVQTGRYSDALPLVDQALALDPQNFEAYVLQGIALSQTEKPEEAISAFRKSIELNPKVPKPHYNLAVHLYGLNRREQALESVRRALEVDPGHEGSQSLAVKIERDLGLRAAEPVREGAPVEETNYFRESEVGGERPGYENDPNVHSLPLVEKLGSNWITIGWVLTAIPFLLMIAGIATGGLSSFSQGANPNFDLGSVSGMIWAMGFARILFGFAAVTWMIMDIIDRRLSIIWIVPEVFCCTCTCGSLHWVIQLIYILVGRKG